LTDLPSALGDADAVVDAVTLAVVVWRADVPRAVAVGDLEMLSPAERLRVSGAATSQVAAGRATAYVLARRAVGLVRAERPADVQLDRACPRCGQQHGRPRVVTDAGLHVSVSHARVAADVREAAPVVVVALTRLAPVGIDLLFARETAFAGFDAVARHCDDAATPDDGSRARLWARKEAVLKAVGRGLDIDPASFPAPRPGTVARIGPDRVPVALVDLEMVAAAGRPTAGAHALVGALALARDDPTVPVVTTWTSPVRPPQPGSGQVG
jgi:4'-phosphopantetheinyl transferase